MKDNKNLKPARVIIRTPQEIKELEQKEKERKFWLNMIYNNGGLGGKKGHDN